MMTTSNHNILKLFAVLLAYTLPITKSDPNPLHDYCVAAPESSGNFFLDGAPCINPSQASASHFATSALSKPRNASRGMFGFSVTLTNTSNLPGLNTQGLAIARVDVAEDALVPLHSHPRASEIIILLKGSLTVGFVDTTNRLFTRQLRAGDSFVFPKGLIHYLYNMDQDKAAYAISGFSSQNPGMQMASMATFASNPEIPNEVLKKSFQINGAEVDKIRRNIIEG